MGSPGGRPEDREAAASPASGARAPLRVAMVAYTRYHTDARVRRQAEALAARGDEVVCFCLRSGDGAPAAAPGVEVVELPLARYRGGRAAAYLLSYALFILAAAGALTVRHLGRRFHVVHAHAMPDFVVLAALPARLLGARVLLDLHDTAPETFRAKFDRSPNDRVVRILSWVERASCLLADRTLAVHDAQRERLVARGHPASRLDVVMNTPDARLFPPRPVSSRARASTSFDLFYHGTVARRHGVDLLVQAVARLADKIPPLRLTVCGEGDALDESRRLAEALGVSSRVTFTGMVPLEEMAARLTAADLEVIPLRCDPATDLMLPVKALEAIACGVPVAASSCRALRRHLGDGEVLYFRPGDPAAIAEALEEAWSDPAGCARRAARAQEVVRGRAWEREKATYLSIVDRLVGRGAEAPRETRETWDRPTGSIRTS